MAPKKILIPLHENDVAPRFDLATEVLIVTELEEAGSGDKRMVVLPRASADKLCHLIITENIQTVICSGIEDDYYQYLTWKRIEVIDSVVGSSNSALKRYFKGKLKPGDIL
jgi:predicted Fe-Mo cluster-binding NifX family protein